MTLALILIVGLPGAVVVSFLLLLSSLVQLLREWWKLLDRLPRLRW